MKLFQRRQPVEMTEEQRLAHEQYVKELNETNEKTVKIVCAVLWCIAMVAWIILLVLDVLHRAGGAKILFHGVAAAITALLALPRVMDFFTAKKAAKETKAAIAEIATLDKDAED